MIISIQSRPSVAATPNAAAIAVPTRAATIPTSSVSHIGIFCLPGATTRPKTPMIKPITKALIIPVTSTVGPPSLAGVDAATQHPIGSKRSAHRTVRICMPAATHDLTFRTWHSWRLWKNVMSDAPKSISDRSSILS